MTLSLEAVSRQKGRASVSKLFHVINLDSNQFGQASDSTSIVKRAKEGDLATAK